MQLFDRRYEASRQREYQLTFIDSPLEYFFNFKYNLNSFRASSEDLFPLPFTGAVVNSESERYLLPRESRIELIPLNLTSFLMRVDNLADNFDQQPSETHYLEFDSLKKHLRDKIFVDHGGKIPEGFHIDITEMSLSGTETYKQMESWKTVFSGIGDEKAPKVDLPKDKSNTTLSMEPQRIRQFFVVIHKT